MSLSLRPSLGCVATHWHQQESQGYIKMFQHLQPQNERYQLIKAHMLSGEITGEHFQSLEYLVQKCGTFANLVAQLSVLNS